MPNTTALSDLVYGTEYTEYSMERAIELNAFAQAGVAVEDERLNTLAAGQGGTYDMPFFKQLGTAEPNISTDDDTVQGARRKITTGTEQARLHMYNNIWSSADLNTALIADDPLDAIAEQTAQYWATWSQTMIIQSALGILADNVANDSGDMVINISTINDASGGAAARCLQSTTMVDAMQTLGDHKNSIVAIGVHSAVHAKLQKLGSLQEHFNMETNELLFETFLGKRVIVDDAMPVASASINDGAGAANHNVYTSVLFGAGAFRLGTGTPKTPTETARDAKAGNGGGVEDLIERRHPIVHPIGFKWLNGSVAGKSATAAELGTAANWDRVKQRKNIPLAFVKSRLD